MNRRVEFTLNLDDPIEQAIYEALTVAMRHRRAGEVIRQALRAYLFNTVPTNGVSPPMRPQAFSSASSQEPGTDPQTTSNIIDQSAAMFGF